MLTRLIRNLSNYFACLSKMVSGRLAGQEFVHCVKDILQVPYFITILLFKETEGLLSFV